MKNLQETSQTISHNDKKTAQTICLLTRGGAVGGGGGDSVGGSILGGGSDGGRSGGGIGARVQSRRFDGQKIQSRRRQPRISLSLEIGIIERKRCEDGGKG